MRMMEAIAKAQQVGMVCALIDIQHTFDTNTAIENGINLRDLLVSQPDSSEQAFQICDTLLRTGAIDMIMVYGPTLPALANLRSLFHIARQTNTIIIFAGELLAGPANMPIPGSALYLMCG